MFSSNSDELQAVASELIPSIKYRLVNVNALQQQLSAAYFLPSTLFVCATSAAGAGWKGSRKPFDILARHHVRWICVLLSSASMRIYVHGGGILSEQGRLANVLCWSLYCILCHIKGAVTGAGVACADGACLHKYNANIVIPDVKTPFVYSLHSNIP